MQLNLPPIMSRVPGQFTFDRLQCLLFQRRKPSRVKAPRSECGRL